MSHQETPHLEPQLDEWHQHAAEEGVPQKENAAHINIGALLISFVLMVVFVLVFVLAVTVFYRSSSAQMAAVRLENTAGWSDDYIPYRDSAIEQINGYHADDLEAGTVRIPVEQAIDQVIEQYGN